MEWETDLPGRKCRNSFCDTFLLTYIVCRQMAETGQSPASHAAKLRSRHPVQASGRLRSFLPPSRRTSALAVLKAYPKNCMR